MPTQRVELEDQEWVTVVALLQEVSAPSRITNPLLMKIGQQLARQGNSGVVPPTIDIRSGKRQ